MTNFSTYLFSVVKKIKVGPNLIFTLEPDFIKAACDRFLKELDVLFIEWLLQQDVEPYHRNLVHSKS